MKAITLSILTIALALGVTAAWAGNTAVAQQACVQRAKEIVASKCAAYTAMQNTITERKTPIYEKANTVAAERTNAAKDACQEKCDTLRGEAATTCPMRQKADTLKGAQDKAPTPPCDCGE